MFERVLVPTDFSRYADQTVRTLAALQIVSNVVLLHVKSAPNDSLSSLLAGTLTGAAKNDTGERLGREQVELAASGIPATTRIVEPERGNIARAILKTAAEEKASLIIMGGRGRGMIEGLLLGSVSADVLRKATTDILIMHFRRTEGEGADGLAVYGSAVFSHIICPTDFSKPSVEAIAAAARLPGVRTITLLHVVRSAESGEEFRLRIAAAEERLRAIRSGLNASVRDVRMSIRFGNPAQETAELAEEQDASLIYVSRWGMSDYTTNIPIGSIAADIARVAKRPVWITIPAITLAVDARELTTDEFLLVEELWEEYHGQKTDPATDRIFGVFVEGTLAAVARCRRHPDGHEVDGVFTPEEYRNRGYARKAMDVLIAACGGETLYMHATLELVSFYGTFGFAAIPEDELPPTIRERYTFALGEMKGSNVCPMKRLP